MPDGKPCSAVAPWLRLQLWLQLCLQLQLQLQLKPVCLCKHKRKTDCALSAFEFAFAWHLEWFFGLADAVRKLMHCQTLIHSCGDLMIPKRLKLLMKVLRRLQRLLRMPSTLSETPSLFFCARRKLPRQLLLLLLLRPAISIRFQHFTAAVVVAFAVVVAVFLWLILQSPQFSCAFVSTHFMCQRNRLRLLLLPDNQNTNWQCGKWLLHWHWPWQGIIHSLTQNGELSVGPTFNGVTQQLVVAATMLQVPLSACSSLS